MTEEIEETGKFKELGDLLSKDERVFKHTFRDSPTFGEETVEIIVRVGLKPKDKEVCADMHTHTIQANETETTKLLDSFDFCRCKECRLFAVNTALHMDRLDALPLSFYKKYATWIATNPE